MKLLLRREQRSAIIGSKPVFVLNVRADISADEKAAIDKYKLGDTELYSSHQVLDKGSGLLGVASRLAWKAVMTTVTVRDLEDGATLLTVTLGGRNWRTHPDKVLATVRDGVVVSLAKDRTTYILCALTSERTLRCDVPR